MSENLFPITKEIKPLKILDKNIFKNNSQATMIFQKFHEFYEDKKFVDIDLIVGPNTIKIQTHRVVLSASSEYFLVALTRNPSLSYMEVKEVDEVVMKFILEFMYTSSIDLDLHHVEGVFRAAVIFQMSLLIEACSAFMEKNINLSNCLSFARIGWENDRPGILKKSLAFAQDHFEEVRNGTAFLQVGPEILRELLSSDFLHVKSEEVVLQNLLDWANFDPDNRHQVLPSLLGIIRYELLDPLFITNIREAMHDIPKCDDIIFGWLATHINNQYRRIIPKIRSRNMTHTYSMLCGESTANWHIMKYDGLLDTWSRKALPSGLRKRTYFKSVVTVDNRIVISGGRINEDITATVETLDLQTNTWTKLPPMGEARMGHVMAQIKGDLFVMGGFGNQSNTLLSVERYNFNTRLWSIIGLMPSQIEYSHRCAIVNDRLYIMDFYSPKKLKCFDALLFEWTEIDFDHDVEKGLDIVVIGDDLYTCLADSDEKSIEKFSPANNKWTALKSDGIERFISPRMFTFSNSLIFWGKASDLSGKVLVEMYDIEKGTFTPLTPLEELLYDLNIK